MNKLLQWSKWVVWFFAFSTGNLLAQTTIINPAGDGGFETGATFAANGWVEVNGTQTNKWYTGTAATGYTGARCAYVGTASTNNSYNISATSYVHFYRDVTFPAGQPNISLRFSWKGYGEGNYDYIRVYLVPTTTTPTAGAMIFGGQLGGDFNLTSAWQTASLVLPCTAAGTTQRLVFSWINDYSVGTMPAGAIDNISLVSNTTSTCNSAMGTGVTVVAALPYNSGPGSTCGQSNDLIASNTAACGSTLYLTGEDRVWVFTPTTTGQHRITLDAPSASWTGLMLYQGCPVGICAAPTGTCITNMLSASGSKMFCVNLTAGVTYYLVLDSYAAPACNAYNNLSIISVTGASCTTLLGTGVTTVASLPYNSGPGTTCGAGNDVYSGNAPLCGATYYLNGEDQVFVFTPAATGQVTITLDAPTATYTGLMLYAGCPVGACGSGTGTCVMYNQDASGSKTSCVNVTAGVTYYLILDSWPSPTCNNYNNVAISAVSTSTAGNTCATAIPVASLPYSVSGHSTACKVNDYTAATAGICNGGFAFGEDIVYAINVSSAQCISISITGATSNNIGYAVYQGGCPGAGGTCIGTRIGATLGSLSGSVTLPAAGTYYLIIDTQNPTTSVTYNLSVTSFGAGATNDRPYQAMPLPFNIPIGGNNSCSGFVDEPGAQPTCFAPAGSNPMNTVWFSFIAPATGCVKIRTTLGTLPNTQIAVYGPVVGTIASGAGNTLSPVGCNQDLPPCGFNTYPSSELSLTGLAPGLTYYIMVDGYAGWTGSFTIFIMDSGPGGTLPFPPTPGQDCTLAFPVCKSNIIVPNPGPQAVGSNCDFPNNVNCLLSGERGSYWYRIQIIAGGFLEFDIIPNDWPGAPSTIGTDYDFAVWRTKTSGVPGPANCSNLATVPPVSCNYSFLGLTGCYSAAAGVSPPAYPGFGAAYQPRIPVNAGDELLLNVSNFTNSTSGFTLNFSAGSPIATVPPAGGTLVWTGTLNTDWYNPENWGGCAAPKCVYNVSIGSIPVNQPSISGLTAVCGSLNITPGATLTMQANSQLKVCTNFINSGTLNAMTNSTILIQSDSLLQNQSMTGGMTGTNRLWNLTVNKPSTAGGNTVTLNNDIDNAGNFTLGSSATYQGGIFNVNTNYHKVAGNFTVYYASAPYSLYNALGATLEFNGTVAQNYFNRGALGNAVMNHTGAGVILGNSGAVDWMTVAGTLTLTQGRIITAANRVSVINNAPAAVTPGNATSFVEGYLKRAFAPTGGIYDFPVGTALRGYQRINFDFGSSNDRIDAMLSFNNTAPAVPTPLLGPECVSATYDQTPLNHGYWISAANPAIGISSYAVTAYNAGYTNPQAGYTVMTRHASAAWALEGFCVPASPITAVQRNGLTIMGTASNFAIAQALTPLPVEMLYLNATALSDYIKVKWATASEMNNRGFEIHRATHPSEFEKIGWVDGKGNSTSIENYEFNDRNVDRDRLYYYRLNQLDFDGHSALTEIVMARLSTSGFTFTALPNPYSDYSNMVLVLSDEADVIIEVYSAIGQLVATPETKRLPPGSYTYEFGSGKAGYAKGVFTVRLKVGDETSFLRLLELE